MRGIPPAAPTLTGSVNQILLSPILLPLQATKGEITPVTLLIFSLDLFYDAVLSMLLHYLYGREGKTS